MTESKPDPAVEALRAKLGVSQQTLLPELAAHTPGEWTATPHGAALLKWAREADAVKTVPETTYTLYRRFRVAGERPSYEGPYFEKRQLLARAVLSAWVAPTEERIIRLNDLIWSICEETTWVVPAHEKKNEGFIDLFASETAADLAHALALLGDRLNSEIRARVHDEVNRRVLDPYLHHAHEYSWGLGRNNWTGVCAGSIGQTFLLMEDDPERLAQGIAYVIEHLDKFIANAFEEDGGCLEGIGYWNYGLVHFVGFAEMLRDRTKGAVDLLANPKLAAIARYPLVAYLGNGLYASFADAHEHSTVHPFLAARFAERYGVKGLLGLTFEETGWPLSTALRNLVWWNGEKPGEPVLEDAFLPQSGIARFCAPPFVLAIKAGHNDEPHNHNDVGSFVLAAGGQVYLCDPGGGLYDASYFGPKRYENVFANSYGHSVPRIGGTLQAPGRTHCGTIERTGEKSVGIRFEKAYSMATANPSKKRS
ncbi:MAG: heparinase II/III family protein [Candidatus Hydrogenedentes bacterium]|nr:heparinase II/III family protein [Candidatus Hydrogenedentota bacterium]